MVPSVFISSTIADLHYLRDGVRDAIVELSYRPVMSEHAEVGYINPTTAADSCYRSVSQCHLMVLIIGRRYGTVGDDGVSVTHREYRAARAKGIPMITFVEPQLLSFHEVFAVDPDAKVWERFEGLDNAKMTFALLTEVQRSETYNAMIPFASVDDAKKKLKLQIADFVGERLATGADGLNEEIRDVLAEVKTIRNLLSEEQKKREPASGDLSTRYLVAARFLLSKRAELYRDFLEAVFRSFDVALGHVANGGSLKGLTEEAGCNLIVTDDIPLMGEVLDEAAFKEKEPPKVLGWYSGTHYPYGLGHIKWTLWSDGSLYIGTNAFEKFSDMQREIHRACFPSRS